jgi:hypothetical protein
MTLQELLYIQLHGEKNLTEGAVKKDVASCIDEEFNFFTGTKRAERILEGLDESLPYVAGLRKAVEFMKVYENKTLKEENLSKNGAKILLHDAFKGIFESIHNLEKSTISYNRANKKELAKVYSTLLFEAQLLGEKYDVDVDDLKFKNEEMKNLVVEDFNLIASEVL